MALSANHAEKLREKYGINPDNLDGTVSSVTPDEASKLLAFPVDSGGILIRYPGSEAFSVRLDKPPVKNGKQLKYLRPRGQRNALFVPPSVNLAEAEIWITEGELKALAASQRTLPVCALSGVWNWRSDIDQDDPDAVVATLTAGKTPDAHALIDDLRRDWSGKRFALVYDSDITRAHPAWPAFGRLAEQLYRLGAVEVKVITLPSVLETGKTGIDDFLLLREKEGHDAAAELRALVAQAPVWLPTGDGAEKYAEHLLSDPTPERVARAAAALLASKGELTAKEATKKLRGQDMQRAAWKEARRILELARQMQDPLPPEPPPRENTARTLSTAFPEVAQVLPPEAPFPEAPDGGGQWDIREGKILLVSWRQIGQEVVEIATVAIDTVAVLTRRLVPLVENSDIEKWEVAWWEPAQQVWRRAHVPASWLFDAGQKRYLIEAGVPISSENADKAVLWFHLFRVAVMGGQIRVPTTRTVARCGWFSLEKGVVFALGRTIIRPQRQEDASLTERMTNEDIAWAQDLSHNEYQIIESFKTGGDPITHRAGLVEAAIKYPQIVFGLGCAAGAPLIRFAQAAGLSEVAGFTVLMHGGDSGRRGRQGKTTWSQVVASFYGPPEPGQRLRYADRTRVQMGVLLSTSSDLTVHIEDLQKIAREAKKAATEEIDYLLHLIAAGMDRERGSRAGGGRLTKTFRSAVLATAEYDVTAAIPAGSGAHDRIMKLPPLFPVDGDEFRQEAERLSRFASTNYGWAGKDYLTWLVGQVQQDQAAIIEALQKSIAVLQTRLPDDERRGSAGRLAKRAGIALAGLALWLESISADEDEVAKAFESFFRAWNMVVDQIPTEDLGEVALGVISSFVAENRELIHGFRQPDAPPPARWVGAKSRVSARDCVVIFENAVAEAIEKRGIDYETAKKALVAAGMLVTTVEGGKRRVAVKIEKAGIAGRGLAFPIDILEQS